MNTKKNPSSIDFSLNEESQNEAVERRFIQLSSKKWVIIRRAFMFLLGFVLYLLYSSLS